MKITVVGTGYVGLSLATLLSRFHEVVALDIIQEKVDMVNNRISPIKDKIIEKFFKEEDLNLIATTNKDFAYKNTNLVIIATPTNYNDETNYFDTSSVESVIDYVIKNYPRVDIVIKSTIPVGFVNSMREKFKCKHIYFSPEFLREGKALIDNLYPSRIVVGDKGEFGEKFSSLLLDATYMRNCPVLLTDPTEAEAIKLFANTYLGVRVAYFNELDNYATKNNLNARDIIKGISLDPRIGDYYNNPSFGFSGYCIPKDSKQLVSNFKNSNTPEDLISACVKSNKTRKQFIADQINELYPNGSIGIYKTAMKAGSDNNRSSAILDIISLLKNMGRDIIIYEPNYDLSYLGCKKANSLIELNDNCSVIVTNRFEDELELYKDKVYTRDVFGEN